MILILALSSLSVKADPPSTHGMLLFGQAHQYVSHLPMFHVPHDYQAIAEVALSAEGKSAYLRDVAEQPKETIYTISPERFSLPGRFQAGKSFSVTLFRGHFERGGVVLLSTRVTIQKVLHFRKLHDEERPTTEKVVLFGVPSEMFSAHVIGGAPDFDQIALVSDVNTPLIGTEIVPTNVPIKTPLTVGQSVLYNAGTRLAGTFEVLRSIYLETGDLSN